MSTKLHGITTQNAVILIIKAVMIPNLTLLVCRFANILGDYSV